MRCVTIVGGGIAGLTLGIILRLRQVPVRVLEAGNYPRHRVCGEFISGRGLDVLRRFGLYDLLLAHGAREARTVQFLSHGTPASCWRAPVPALAISRFALDDLLARKFCGLGGDLTTGSRWTSSYQSEGVVRATGRRVGSSRDWRWIGLKAHAVIDSAGADLEMHFGSLGYAGVARLGEGQANICALIGTRKAIPHLDRDWPRLLEEMVHRKELRWDPNSFSAVAGFSFQPPAAAPGECSLGDAMAMIPPLTGNGMSIALESAALAAEPLTGYASGSVSWNDASRQVAAGLDSHFRERLRWAGFVQKLVFTRGGRSLLRLLVTRCEGIMPFLFARTR